jgi:hypothetical protein
MASFLILGQGWPCKGGSLLVPAGTVLDSSDWTYLGSPLSWPPPRNVQPLDDGALEMLRRSYPMQEHLLHRPPPAKGT